MGLIASRPAETYPRNDFELAIRTTKELEHLLQVRFGCMGPSLHNKISEAGSLPPDLVRQLRTVATIRNKLVHEHAFDRVPNRTLFIDAYEQARAGLMAIADQRDNPRMAEPSRCVIC
eukprot:jgi/Mesvir1/23554/Mv18251-RA.1